MPYALDDTKGALPLTQLFNRSSLKAPALASGKAALQCVAGGTMVVKADSTLIPGAPCDHGFLSAAGVAGAQADLALTVPAGNICLVQVFGVFAASATNSLTVSEDAVPVGSVVVTPNAVTGFTWSHYADNSAGVADMAYTFVSAGGDLAVGTFSQATVVS